MNRIAALGTLAMLVASAGPAGAQGADAGRLTVDVQGLVLEPPSGAAYQAQPAPPPPPPPPPRPRRLGSMVGYIEDPVIESKVRLRFDLARHNTVPDRAEFFYAKCGCYSDLDPADPAFDPEAPGPRPGAANDIRFQQLYINGEFALSPRISAFGQLPFRWLQPQSFIPGTGAGFPNEGGIEDIRAGVRLGLVTDEGQRVTAQARLFLPTGDASRGLGTDHASLEPALLYYQGVNEVVAIESQAGVWLPFDGAAPIPTHGDGRFAGDIFFYGIGPSFSVYRSDRVRFAPIVELVGWRVLNGNQTAADPDAGGTNIANLKLGARTVFEQGSFYVGFGFALTDQSWYDDVLRFEYRVEF
jgi:hypothetical protein